MLRDLEPLAMTWGAYAFAVLLGLLWGSFANVCIYRWPPTDQHPRGRSVVAPGSHCFACSTPIRWYDNVPLLSWLWLRGRCRTCKAPFSARYLIVEAVTGLLFGLTWWMAIEVGALSEPFDQRLIRFAIYATFCLAMVVIAFIDLDHKLILDKITLPSIVIFYGAGLLLGRPWQVGLIGAAVGYGLPWSIAEIYYVLMGREGLGLGDAKLLAVVGALFGAVGVVASLFGGALVGSVVGVIVLLRAPASPDQLDVADAVAQRPGRRLAPALLMIASVASVVCTTVAAMFDRVYVALFSSVIAIAALIIARRFDTMSEEAEPVSNAPHPQGVELVPANVLGPRVLALSAACFVLVGVSGAVLGLHRIGLGGGVIGIGLLLIARKVGGADMEPATEEPRAAPVAEEEPSSPMRTELPFGPFLVIAAVFYMFAEPWIVLKFRFLGG